MFNLFKKKKEMPLRFNELAKYNTSISEGIVHTKTYIKMMNKLQEEYNLWIGRVV